jgi:hypothetical protein
MNLVVLRQYRLVYLATPYSRYPGGLQKAFEDACKLTARLIRNQVRVYSPIAHTHPIAIYGGIDPLDHGIWIPLDKPLMSASDALVVAEMETWSQSKGIQIEIDEFYKADKPVYYINPNSLMVRK